MRQLLARGLAEVSRLSMADFEVLDSLPGRAENGVPFAELARSLRWQTSHLAHQLTRMENHGLVRRLRLGLDRRSVTVERTDEGHRVHQIARRCQSQCLRRSLSDVATEDQLAAIADVCEEVLDALDDRSATRPAGSPPRPEG